MADTKKVDVKKVADEAAAKAKDVAEKTAVTAKKTAESAKTTATKAVASAEKTVETAKAATAKTATKAKKTAKKAVAKKKNEVTRSAVLQFGGSDYKVEEIIDKAQAAFKAENKRKAVSDIKVYIKPEENAAYYVVTSGESEYVGRIDL